MLWAALLAILICLTSTASASELSATVDRNKISVNETLTLTVRFDGQATSEPDFSALEYGFDVLSTQQQTQLNFTNGKREAYTLWTLQLLPRQSGTLIVPSFTFKGEVSDAIEITVSERAAGGTPSGQQVYMETEIDKSDAYVQEQIILTHRLVSRVNLSGYAGEELQLGDAEVVKLSEDQYQKRVGGVAHLVIESRYAIFPQASGTLNIPSVRFSVGLQDPRDPFSGSLFSRPSKKQFLRSEAKAVEIKPRPSGASLDTWLPSKGVSLTDKWSRPLDEIRVGEPVTRTVTAIAQGLTAAQIPPLNIPESDDFRIYPDQPQLADRQESSGVIGTRSDSFAIVPTKAGELTLPAVTVRWWDTISNQPRETTLAAKTVRVLPAESVRDTSGESPDMAKPETGSPPARQVRTSNPNSSFWVVAVLAGLNLLFLIVIIWLAAALRRASHSHPLASPQESPEKTEKALFGAIKVAAKDGDLDGCQRAIHAWASKATGNKVSSNVSLGEVPGCADIVDQLRLMAEKTYSGEPDSDGLSGDFTILLDQLERCRKSLNSANRQSSNKLKPLYETSI
ncbi:MAG: BatD family protein [bacterium]